MNVLFNFEDGAKARNPIEKGIVIPKNTMLTFNVGGFPGKRTCGASCEHCFLPKGNNRHLASNLDRTIRSEFEKISSLRDAGFKVVPIISYLISAGLGHVGNSEDTKVGRAITEVLMNPPRGDSEDLYADRIKEDGDVRTHLRNKLGVDPDNLSLTDRIALTNQIVKTAMGNIQAHEEELTQRIIDGLKNLGNVRVLGPLDAKDRAGLVSFYIVGMSVRELSPLLSQHGIDVREGYLCAHLAAEHVGSDARGREDSLSLGGEPGRVPVVRMSVYVYNTPDEIDRAVGVVRRIATERLK